MAHAQLMASVYQSADAAQQPPNPMGSPRPFAHRYSRARSDEEEYDGVEDRTSEISASEDSPGGDVFRQLQSNQQPKSSWSGYAGYAQLG